MNDKTKHVYRGWLELDNSEKQELIDAIKEYEDSSSAKKEKLIKSFKDYLNEIYLGPLGKKTCPCCGR